MAANVLLPLLIPLGEQLANGEYFLHYFQRCLLGPIFVMRSLNNNNDNVNTPTELLSDTGFSTDLTYSLENINLNFKHIKL